MKNYFFLIGMFLLLFNSSVVADKITDLKTLADEGDPVSQNNLGYSYLYGLDGEKDIDKAIFYLSADHRERFLLEQWQELAVNRYTHKANYYNEYVGAMEIYQLGAAKATRTFKSNIEDTSGGSGDHRTSKYNHGFEEESFVTYEPIRTYGIRVEEVFPETIAGIEYAYATVDEIAKLTVSFQYRKWKEIEPE